MDVSLNSKILYGCSTFFNINMINVIWISQNQSILKSPPFPRHIYSPELLSSASLLKSSISMIFFLNSYFSCMIRSSMLDCSPSTPKSNNAYRFSWFFSGFLVKILSADALKAKMFPSVDRFYWHYAFFIFFWWHLAFYLPFFALFFL